MDWNGLGELRKVSLFFLFKTDHLESPGSAKDVPFEKSCAET